MRNGPLLTVATSVDDANVSQRAAIASSRDVELVDGEADHLLVVMACGWRPGIRVPFDPRLSNGRQPLGRNIAISTAEKARDRCQAAERLVRRPCPSRGLNELRRESG